VSRDPTRLPRQNFNTGTKRALRRLSNEPLRLSCNMADTILEELNALFAPNAKISLEADVLTELKSIMRLHGIPPQELFYKWESYSMKMGSDDMKLNIDTARALKKDIQDGLEKETRGKAHIRTADKRGGATPRHISNTADVFGM
jgi:DNA polymerase alpha subunit B